MPFYIRDFRYPRGEGDGDGPGTNFPWILSDNCIYCSLKNKKYNGILFSLRMEIMPFATTWMKLGDTFL